MLVVAPLLGQPLNDFGVRPVVFQPLDLQSPEFKIETKKFGAILGIQRGKFTMFELGAEKQWKTVKIFHPPTIAVNGLMHYNFANNILGYKLGVWSKKGRIALTYGAELAYVTNFDQFRIGGGPQIGLKLLGFHLVNGYNFLTKSDGFDTYNPIYVSIRYYFINQRKYSLEKKNGKSKGKKNSFWDNFKLDKSKKD